MRWGEASFALGAFVTLGIIPIHVVVGRGILI